jgi:hypothetical protein
MDVFLADRSSTVTNGHQNVQLPPGNSNLIKPKLSERVFAGPNLLYPSGQSNAKLGTTSAPFLHRFCAFALWFPLFARVSVKNCTIALLGRRSQTLRTGFEPSKEFKGIQSKLKPPPPDYPTYSNFNPTTIQVQSRFNPT